MKKRMPKAALLASILVAAASGSWAAELPSPGTILTVAGNGKPNGNRTSALATGLSLDEVFGLAVNSLGELFFDDTTHNQTWRVSPDGAVTVIAGNGSLSGISGEEVPAIRAAVHADDLALDGKGNVYLLEYEGKRVRRVNVDGTIVTVAGGGTKPFARADGGPATEASLPGPGSVLADAAGDLFITDLSTHTIRKVTPGGIITTVAGTGQPGFSGDGGPAVMARLNLPFANAVDGDGNLFIADFANQRVRRIGTDGIIATVAGTGEAGFSGDGGPAVQARLNHPVYVTVDGAGNLFIADNHNFRIRRVSPDGIISTVAGTGKPGFSGDGGPALDASLKGPVGLTVDSAGDLLFTDSGPLNDGSFPSTHDGGRIRKVFGAAASGLLAGKPFARGDVDGDGAITLGDAIVALHIAVGLLMPTPAQRRDADVDGDGAITEADATIILRRAIGL